MTIMIAPHNLIVVLFLLLWNTSIFVTSSFSLRGAEKEVDRDEIASHMHRHLVAVVMNSTLTFVPQSCNAKIDQVPCQAWTSVYGTTRTKSNVVVIPCGQCIQMDHPGPYLTLSSGLDIQGKLVFPNRYKGLTLNTPFIAIQGKLQMSASNVVGGVPNVLIQLTGTSTTARNGNLVMPIGNNSMACGGKPCNIGDKAISVMGGQINIQGLPSGATSWALLYDVLSDHEIVLPMRGVYGVWGAGAEVLVTSHTRVWNEHQVRTIKAVTLYNTNYVKLTFNDTIVRPTTSREGTNFATEVALLSRNFLFQGDMGSDRLLGAHFWVMSTPKLFQYLEGVEFRNFGQQGKLGRYPIHFHHCADVSGSSVVRNTIRQSNQRCVVIHGTNNVNIQENIAYDTKGHCYMLEDGIETGNTFYRNLGAKVDRPTRIIPDMGSNGFETDGSPSTFWITNPTNKWIDNVAAGSIGSGYWFELKFRGMFASQFTTVDPASQNLGAFSGNVAHSNSDVGLRTYPRTGFTPIKRAQFQNLRFFRNPVTGLFIHASRRIDIVGGVFADNGIAIDVDRTDDTRIVGSLIIGQSALLTRQGLSACYASQLVGIQLPLFGGEMDWGGTTVTNVTFRGFDPTTCIKDTRPVRIDGTSDSFAFWGFSAFQGTSLESATSPVNFCDANAAGVDSYITDMDGSLRPASVSSSSPSTLVAPVYELLRFVNPALCTNVTNGCHMYCRGVCHRTVRFDVDPSTSSGYILKVCLKSSPGICLNINGELRWRDKANESPLWSERNLQYSASLPNAKYTMQFFDSNGKAVWPTYVTPHFQDFPLCPTSFQNSDITLVTPSVSEESCQFLIKNGGAEASKTSPTSWLYTWGGISVVPGSGVSKSNAFAGTDSKSSSALTQYLDSRCLTLLVGRMYEISVWVKLVKPNGSVQFCDADRQTCPEAGVTWSGKPLMTSAYEIPQFSPGDYQLLHGILTVTQEMAGADRVSFFVVRNVANVLLYMDNASLRLIPKSTPTSPQCSNLVYNGNFNTGDARFWTRNNAQATTVVNVGTNVSPNYALQMKYGRTDAVLRTGCLVVGKSYAISASYKLLDASGRPTACNGNYQESFLCPRAMMAYFVDGNRIFTDPALSVGTPSKDWNQLSVVFKATNDMVRSQSLYLMFTYLDNVVYFIVDNVVVRPL